MRVAIVPLLGSLPGVERKGVCVCVRVCACVCECACVYVTGQWSGSKNKNSQWRSDLQRQVAVEHVPVVVADARVEAATTLLCNERNRHG